LQILINYIAVWYCRGIKEMIKSSWTIYHRIQVRIFLSITHADHVEWNLITLVICRDIY